jgi:hypothetical protein
MVEKGVVLVVMVERRVVRLGFRAGPGEVVPVVLALLVVATVGVDGDAPGAAELLEEQRVGGPGRAGEAEQG